LGLIFGISIQKGRCFVIEIASWALGAIGSAIIGSLVKDGYDRIKKNRLIRQKGLEEGNWYSSYQWVDQPNEWIDETVGVKVRRGYLNLDSTNPSSQYEAEAELVGQEFVKGWFTSKRSGAHEAGVFMFAISPGGEMLYGYYIGPTDTGERRFGKWVMAKEQNNIAAARAILERVCP
jgi:hypothetical protein